MWNEPVKINYVLYLTLGLSLVFYTLTFVKVMAKKRTEPIQSVSGQILPRKWTHALPKLNYFLGTHHLASFGTIAFALSLYLPAAVVVVHLNGLKDPEMLGKYPNYLLVSCLHHDVVFLWHFFLIANYFLNSKAMQLTVTRELKDLFSMK